MASDSHTLGPWQILRERVAAVSAGMSLTSTSSDITLFGDDDAERHLVRCNREESADQSTLASDVESQPDFALREKLEVRSVSSSRRPPEVPPLKLPVRRVEEDDVDEPLRKSEESTTVVDTPLAEEASTAPLQRQEFEFFKVMQRTVIREIEQSLQTRKDMEDHVKRWLAEMRSTNDAAESNLSRRIDEVDKSFKRRLQELETRVQFHSEYHGEEHHKLADMLAQEIQDRNVHLDHVKTHAHEEVQAATRLIIDMSDRSHCREKDFSNMFRKRLGKLESKAKEIENWLCSSRSPSEMTTMPHEDIENEDPISPSSSETISQSCEEIAELRMSCEERLAEMTAQVSCVEAQIEELRLAMHERHRENDLPFREMLEAKLGEITRRVDTDIAEVHRKLAETEAGFQESFRDVPLATDMGGYPLSATAEEQLHLAKETLQESLATSTPKMAMLRQQLHAREPEAETSPVSQEQLPGEYLSEAISQLEGRVADVAEMVEDRFSQTMQRLVDSETRIEKTTVSHIEDRVQEVLEEITQSRASLTEEIERQSQNIVAVHDDMDMRLLVMERRLDNRPGASRPRFEPGVKSVPIPLDQSPLSPPREKSRFVPL
jgi:DNA anti-recombination protein RmuC